MNDIFDIKPPVEFGIDPAIFYYSLISVLILAIFAVLFFVLRKKQKKRKTKNVVTLLPDEIAFKQLDKLAGLVNPDGKEFYFRLSSVLRGYIQGRFLIDALEMTSEELFPRVDELDFDKELKRGIKDFLRFSDPVKFAGKIADSKKMQTDLMFVKDFVKQTTPLESCQP